MRNSSLTKLEHKVEESDHVYGPVSKRNTGRKE